jgi:DNA-binding CsgD family transcriptional regulator
MGILTLPMMWSGRGQDHVVKTLLDAVCRTLELDFVYAHLNLPEDKRIEMLRVADSGNANSDGLRELLRQWLKDHPKTRPHVLLSRGDNGKFALAAFRLGADERIGVLIAGSHRSGFPSKSERLLLNVAADQAAIGLREAQLLSELGRTAASDVTFKTSQLVVAHDEKESENEQRRAVEQASLSLAAQVATAAERAKGMEEVELRKNYALLTAREREVLPFVVAGRLSKQTAAELGTSEITIRVHRGQIMRKMQARSLAELIRMADKLGIA